MNHLTKNPALLLAALVLATASQVTAQEYTFLTLAGPVEAGPGAIDGPGNVARFNAPESVAVDRAGNVYVADTYNNTIRKVTRGGLVTTLAGSPCGLDSSGGPIGGYADGTGSAARFNYARAVAVDNAGNVYVADEGNSAIRKVTPAGVVTTLAGDPSVLDGNGNPVSGSADGTGSAARFYRPQGVAVDSAGNVYVADTDNNTIRKVTPGGVVTTPAGLAGTPGSADGTGSAARFGSRTVSPSGPYGVAVDGAANLYVADTWNHTIRKVTPDGVVTTLAGLVGVQGTNDGTGGSARFNGPDGVAVDGAGNVYVADTYN